MTIKSVEGWVHLPLPLETRHTSDFGRTTSFDATLVRIDTQCGLTGWGGAEAQVGRMAVNQALTVMINAEFAPLLLGEEDAFSVQDGEIKIPDRPGLGITVPEDFLADHPVR